MSTLSNTFGADLAAGAVTSELNNLLHIIAGTSAMIENNWQSQTAAAQYFELMRDSVNRATAVSAQLVADPGAAERKIIRHPEFAGPLPTASRRQRGEKARVLVVDDEQMMLDLATRVLEEDGRFEIFTAQSAFQCLDLCGRNAEEFDVVVLDLTMPFMDGEETFNRLRSIAPGVQVILTTGYVAQERLERMFANGLAGFMRKPLPPDEYISTIQTALGIN